MSFAKPVLEKFSKIYWAVATIQQYRARCPLYVFNSAVPIEELLIEKDIRLVDDLNGNHHWGMHRIIQRNITGARVDEINNKFLRNSQKNIKFFPGITVAILPQDEKGPIPGYKDGDGFKGIDGFFVFDPSGEKAADPENYEGGWNYPYQIKWDKSKLSALVIDGQHRVSALRKFYDHRAPNSNELDSVPVSFLVFPSEASSTIESTRQVFIDVNNTPRRVSEQKLIFIDDRNITRRITSRVLGSKEVSEDEVDPYVKMLDDDAFDENLLDGALNRYLIAQDESDDEALGSYTRSHDSLFPWEATHIMTLHEVILQSILLSYGKGLANLGKKPDIRRVCELINNTILENIESWELEVGQDGSDGEKELKSEASKLVSDAGIKLFNLVIERRRELLEALVDLDRNEEDKSEIENEKEAYRRFCEDAASFEMASNHLRELLEKDLLKVQRVLSGVFRNLSFYRNVIASIENDEFVHRTHKFRFLVHARENPKARKRSALKKVALRRDLVNSYVDTLGPDQAEVGVSILKWIESFDEGASDNILRSQVGQQSIFSLFLVKDDASDRFLDWSEQQIKDFVVPINRLLENGFFSRKQNDVITLLGKEYSFSPLEGILVVRGKPNPGWLNVKKFTILIGLIEQNKFDRTHFKASVSEYNKVIKPVGSAILSEMKNDYSIEEIREWLSEKDDLERYITENRKDTICNPDLPNSENKVETAVKEALGGIYIEKVVKSYNTFTQA